MEYERVVAGIESGRPAPTYLLYGPDRFQQLEVLAALRRTVTPDGLGEVHLDQPTAAQVALAAATVALGGGRLVCCDGLPAEPAQPLLRYLDHPAPHTIVVIRCDEPDRRRRLTQSLLAVGIALECRPPTPAEAIDWLRARGLDRRAATLLAERLPPSLGLYEQEIEKLRAYGAMDAAAVQALVPPGREERVFALLDAVGEGRPDQALALAATLLRQGEDALGLMALLAGQFRLMLRGLDLERQGWPPARIASELGAHPYALRKALERAHRFRPEEALALALEVLWAAEWAVKSGRRDPATALDMALIQLLPRRPQPPARRARRQP